MDSLSPLTGNSNGYSFENGVEAQRKYKKNGITERGRLDENRVHPLLLRLLPLGGSAILNVDARLGAAAADDVGDGDVGQHGKEVAGRCQHEGERVLFRREGMEGGIRIAQEMHESSSEEDAAGELGAKEEEALVPPVEVRRDSAGEGGDEHDDQAPHLHQHQPFPVQAPLVPCRRILIVIVVVIVGAAVGCDVGKLEKE